MNQSYSTLFTTLNPAQQQAVSTSGCHLRVLAGAGSGKTRVLVSRIAWLMQAQGLSPHHFLAVTFTNKAAHEMRGRLEQLLQQPLSMMWVGTFHGLAHRMLRQHWEAAGLIQHFQILDAEDQHRLIKRVIRSLDLDEARFQPRQVQWFINQQKDEGLRANQLTALSDPYQKTLAQLYQAYETACLREGAMDFAELLLCSYELLQRHPDILQHYHERFQQLLVDEFQDTSTLQYAWIKLLTSPQSYLTIVGDDDQSIYGWRGARIENMHRFSRDFPNSQSLSLEQNYRSTGVILAAANALIAHNHERIGKNLWTEGAEGERIAVYAAFSDLDEARFIVERIQLALEEGFSLKEIALLYRSNAQSRVLEEALIHARIPYRIYGGLRFFERAEIKDALAYLRLVSHHDDDTAFERIINTPTRGLGEKTLEILRAGAREQSLSLWQAAHQLLSQSSLPTRAAHALQHFLQLIEQLALSIQSLPFNEQAAYILTHSGLMAYYQKSTGEKAQARLENLTELITATQQFVPDPGHPISLSAFLNHVALDAGDYQASDVQVGVQLMTLHAAKGLEFPLVFISGLEEGLFPSHMALSEPGRLEEERRLCYVGMTRAMRKLYLTYAELRRYQGNESYRIPSRFLQEIPEALLQAIRLKTPLSRNTTPTEHSIQNADSGVAQTIATTGFHLGQRIRHPSFGVGTILNYEGQDPHTRIQVKFDQVGSKWLVAHFARLEAL